MRAEPHYYGGRAMDAVRLSWWFMTRYLLFSGRALWTCISIQAATSMNCPPEPRGRCGRVLTAPPWSACCTSVRRSLSVRQVSTHMSRNSCTVAVLLSHTAYHGGALRMCPPTRGPPRYQQGAAPHSRALSGRHVTATSGQAHLSIEYWLHFSEVAAQLLRHFPCSLR